MGWDIGKDAKLFVHKYHDDEIKDTLSVDKNEFYRKTREFWDFCNHTESAKDIHYHIQSDKEETISKKDMFDYYKELNWCKNIQSKNQSCGYREDVNMSSMTIPKIVRLSCKNNTLYINQKMETIEIMIYIGVAIMVGGFMIGILTSFNHKESYDAIRDNLKDDKQYFKITSSELAKEIAKRWDECRYGFDNMSFKVYVKDKGIITHDKLIKDLKKADTCTVIDCYNKSNTLHIKDLTIPKIINIRCVNNSLIIE